MMAENQPCLVCGGLQMNKIFRIRPTPSTIRQSGKKGCQGCRLLWEGFREFYPSLDRDNPQSILTAEDEVTLKIESSPEHGKGLQLLPVVSEEVLKRLCQSLNGIEFYITEDWKERPWSQVWRANQISGDTSSDASFQALRSWLTTCSKSHGCHDDSTDPEMPRRVVDISQIDMPFIYENPGKTGRYVCLSYCWGQKLNAITTKANLEDRKQAMPFLSLPKTFQDAIHFAKRLGVQYIWIDAVCIIQDDENDWKTEAAKMKNIYSNAYLTIAASSSADSNGGCYKVSPSASRRPYEFTYIDNQGISHPIFIRSQTHHGLLGKFEEPRFYADFHENWPLRKRAWVFQERLLSSRIVYFTTHELMWECNGSDVSESNRCECSNFGWVWSLESILKRDFQGYLTGEIKLFEELEFWWSLIKQYTQLELSHAEDRLHALAGIAEKFHPRFQGKYFAGLWEVGLVRSLGWTSASISNRRAQKYRAPTWSWASVDGPVIGPSFKQTPVKIFGPGQLTMSVHRIDIKKVSFEILERKVLLLNNNPYGPVQAAHLIIKAQLASAKMYYSNNSDQEDQVQFRFVFDPDLAQPVTGRFCADYSFFKAGQYHISSGNEVKFLKLPEMGTQDQSWNQIMVLIRSNVGANHYERIGIISEKVPKDLTVPWFERAEESVIIIV